MGLCGSKLLKKEFEEEAPQAPRPSAPSRVGAHVSPPPPLPRARRWLSKLGLSRVDPDKMAAQEDLRVGDLVDVLESQPSIYSQDSRVLDTNEAAKATDPPAGESGWQPALKSEVRTGRQQPRMNFQEGATPPLGFRHSAKYPGLFYRPHRRGLHSTPCSQCTSETMYSQATGMERDKDGNRLGSWEAVVW